MEKHFIPNTEGVIFANKKKFSFSIDSILLSHFSKVKKDKILIDIGAGTGIIGFRINFLNNLKSVYLIEIQNENSELIKKSIEENKLNNVILLNKDLNLCFDDFANSSVDYIVKFSYKKLKSGGKVFLIYSIERLIDVLSESRKYKLEPKRIQFISTNVDSKPHLFMVELVKNGNSNLFVEENIYIYDKNGEYTNKIKEIYYGKSI